MTEITLQEGLRRVFEYHEEPCPEIRLEQGRFCRTVDVGGQAVPVFSYRTYPKFDAMKKLELLGTPCALTVSPDVITMATASRTANILLKSCFIVTPPIHCGIPRQYIYTLMQRL